MYVFVGVCDGGLGRVESVLVLCVVVFVAKKCFSLSVLSFAAPI